MGNAALLYEKVRLLASLIMGDAVGKVFNLVRRGYHANISHCPETRRRANGWSRQGRIKALPNVAVPDYGTLRCVEPKLSPGGLRNRSLYNPVARIAPAEFWLRGAFCFWGNWLWNGWPVVRIHDFIIGKRAGCRWMLCGCLGASLLLMAMAAPALAGRTVPPQANPRTRPTRRRPIPSLGTCISSPRLALKATRLFRLNIPAPTALRLTPRSETPCPQT